MSVDDEVVHLIFKKNRSLLKDLGRLFSHAFDFDDRGFTEEPDSARPRNPLKLVDYHEYVPTRKGPRSIDLFYGKSRVFVVIRGTHKQHQQLVKALQKHAKWIKR